MTNWKKNKKNKKNGHNQKQQKPFSPRLCPTDSQKIVYSGCTEFMHAAVPCKSLLEVKLFA